MRNASPIDFSADGPKNVTNRPKAKELVAYLLGQGELVCALVREIAFEERRIVAPSTAPLDARRDI